METRLEKIERQCKGFLPEKKENEWFAFEIGRLAEVYAISPTMKFIAVSSTNVEEPETTPNQLHKGI